MSRLRWVVGLWLLSLCALASQAIGQMVTFLDEDGAATAVYVEGSRAIVRVEDPAANVSPGVDTVQVQLTSSRAGDAETLTLTETGPSTGVFRGEIRLAPGNASQPGVLETAVNPDPPFDRDTIHAAYGPATATATMVGSKVMFLDPYGRPTTRLVGGQNVRIRLIAPLYNGDPANQDYTQVFLTSATNDQESVYVQETGFDTGVFEGEIRSDVSSPVPYNYVIEAFPEGQTVTVEAQDLDAPTTSQATATLALNRLELVDAQGKPADFYLESSRVYVVMMTRGGFEQAPSTYFAHVTADLSGDSESVTLRETGAGTGIFQGSIAMRRGPALANNGFLETTEAGPPYHFDTVRVSDISTGAADAVPTIGSLTSFLDEYGNEVSAYTAGATVVVRVEDHNANNPGAFDSTQAVVQSLSTGDAETLTLQEVARDSGIFEGRIATGSGAAAPGDSLLQIQSGETIQAMHVDSYPQLASGALARIDLLKVQFIDETGRPTSELLEGAPVRVRVISPADNTSSARVDTVTVQIASGYAGDQETVVLAETGVDTGVFEGSLPSHYQPGVPGDGTLDTTDSGPPEFRAETVTASVGPYSATAHLVGARVMFIDEFGRPTSSFPLGVLVRVRVIDHSSPNDPLQQDYLTAYVSSSYDQEMIYLQETGFNTGVYEGAIWTGPGCGCGADFGNGQLSVSAGVTVTASYQNPNRPVDITADASITGGQILFLDGAGQPASVYLEGTQARVRVIDHGADLHAIQADTVTVNLSTDLSGDAEHLTLTETGQSTGVFEGTIQIRHGSPSANDGSIEPGEDFGPPHQFDTIHASYTASYNGGTTAAAVGVRNFRIWFIDEIGQLTDHYAQQSRLYVRVEDHRNDNPAAFDRLVVHLFSATGDEELLELTETGRSTGIFEGSMPIDGGAPASDGRLQAGPGASITAQAEGDYTAEPAQARIDALTVGFIDDLGQPTSELLEGAPVRVRVVSPSDNTGSARVDTVTAQLGSAYAGDQETVVLAETGADTGVFEGSIPSRYQPGVPGDGTLDTTDSGPPEFRAETVTASVGSYSATAHLVGARVMFIDDFGRPASSFPLGVPVRVRVIDFSHNDPAQQDYLTAYVSSSYDQEMIYLQETGFNTGVYEGAILTTGSGCGCGGDLGNGQLSVSAGVTVTASYQNPNRPVDITAEASITGGQILFLDGAGQPASVYLEGTQARVRVIDHGADLHPIQPDTVTVNLSTDLSGDTEHLTLTETGQQTGVFEGTIQIRHGSPAANDGWIEPGEDLGPPHQFDTIHASYAASYNGGTATAAVGTQNFRFWLIDAYGQVTSHYADRSRVYVRLEDHQNDDPGAIQRIPVLVTSSTGDQEQLELVETGRTTGIYEGSLPLDSSAVPAADGRLQAGPGSVVSAMSAVSFTADPPRAVIDGLSVAFIDETGRPTPELLEGAPVQVRVVSPSDNTDSARVDTITAQLASGYAGDQETVVLSETGADTGVFEGSIPSHYHPGVPGDGTLDTTDGGPPEFRAETVTASVGSYSATAHLVGARVTFIDEFGRPVSSFPLGVPVRVRVVDFSSPNDPLQQDFVTAYVSSSYDFELIYLQETGVNTGVYEGEVATGSQYGFNDGQLMVSAGDTITASYQNPNRPVDIVAQASITGSQVLFLDDAGQPASVYLEGTQAHLRVEDHQRSGSVAAQVTTDLTGDQETVTLQETSPGTGVFEGSVRMITTRPALPNSGSLETGEDPGPPFQYDTLRATYMDAANLTSTATATTLGYRIWFIDAGGQVIDHFAAGTRAYVRLEWHNSTDPGAVDTFYVRLTSSSGDEEALQVTETGNDTGIFEGSIPLDDGGGVTQLDGKLQVLPGGEITVDRDGTLAPTPARASIGAGSNRPPQAVDDTADASRHNREVVIDVLANDSDPDGDPLSILSVTQPDFGTVTINPDKTLTYTVTTGGTVVGQDSFTYVVTDPHGGQAVGHVIVQLNRDNHPAVANDDTVTVVENGSVTIPVLANDSDPDGDPLTIDVFVPPAHGSTRINADQTVTYTPATDFVGTDSFVYLAMDGIGGNAKATVTVTVTQANRPPVANADAATLDEDTSANVAVLANDSDPDNDSLTVASVTQGSHGAVAINPDGTVRYTPAADYNGPDAFTYTVSDGHGGTATGTVAINVSSVNDAPIANPDSASVAEDGTVSIPVLANDTDPEGDTLVVTAVTQGTHGAVVINPDKTVRYTPAANYNGADAFTYTISDGNGGTTTGTVSISVTPVNDPPVAVSDAATVVAGQAVTVAVLANDTDIDGPALVVTSVTQGAHGTVAINGDQTVTYTAGLYLGSDSFTYTVSDGAGGTATATVTVNLTTPQRVATGIQARYDFNEGSGNTIADTSGVGTPLDITIGKPALVSWLSGGLAVNDGGAKIESASKATKIINAVQASNEITVEAWIQPASLTLTGPAGILEVSKNPAQGALLFGQSGGQYETQLKTSAGTPALQSPASSVSLNLAHVVYTRTSSGQATYYVNGVQVASQPAAGILSVWGADQTLVLADNWRGDYFLLAIYGRALTGAEVQQNYLAGVGAN